MNLNTFTVKELSSFDKIHIDGGGWYNVYRFLAAEIDDIVAGFQEGWNAAK